MDNRLIKIMINKNYNNPNTKKTKECFNGNQKWFKKKQKNMCNKILQMRIHQKGEKNIKKYLSTIFIKIIKVTKQKWQENKSRKWVKSQEIKEGD